MLLTICFVSYARLIGCVFAAVPSYMSCLCGLSLVALLTVLSSVQCLTVLLRLINYYMLGASYAVAAPVADTFIK
jgi:hypothetical protein